MKLPAWVNIKFWSKDESAVSTFDINSFKEQISKIKVGNKATKQKEIEDLLLFKGLKNHHRDKKTKRKVLAACNKFEYPHECHTAKKLAAENYDVVFVPTGYFQRAEKKFDIFLLRDHIFLEADLKCITTTNPDTLGNRIKKGSEQSSRVVLDITSVMPKNDLIDGIKIGCEKNHSLIEILLFYHSRFYCLPKSQILSRRIFDIIK